MIPAPLALRFKKLTALADWRLLLFLILFLNVKLVVKIPALLLIFILNPNFNFGFSFKNSRLPLFYPIVILIVIVNWLLSFGHPAGYTPVALSGLCFWLLCLLCAHQLKYIVESRSTDIIHKTLLVFFILNTLVSFLNIAAITWEIKSLNPYLYQGQYQKYFINTGDFIRGISFDTSTTNALISAFGVLYFIAKKNILMVCACMCTLLLTGSNFININLLLILAAWFVLKSDKIQKSAIIACVGLLALFMVKVSPHNNKYVVDMSAYIFLHKQQQGYVPPVLQVPVTKLPDSLLSPAQRRQKIAQLFIDSVNTVRLQSKQAVVHAPLVLKANIQSHAAAQKLDLPKPDINTPPYQTRTFTDDEQKRLIGFIGLHKNSLPLSGSNNYHESFLPGKVISTLQTFSFFKQHPLKMITGTGAGNFSSKLAYRVSGLGFAGGFPAKLFYINPDFLQNHLDVYLNFFSKRPGMHSLTNSPNATYDQLLAEYGIAGLMAFFAGYIWFFARHYRALTYGLPILLLMLSAFFIDYWFEQLSVVVLFELMLFLNIKEKPKVPIAPNLLIPHAN